MDDYEISDLERLQMAQLRELEMDELEVEEVHVDADDLSDDDHSDSEGASALPVCPYDTSLVPLHSYLGDVEDTHNRMAFLDGGAVLTLPLIYLEGVVLFPEAKLPLRVIISNFIASVNRAMRHVEAPYTIGVVHVRRKPNNRGVWFSPTGTTAEIRQYRRLEDGSVNIVARGQQRFRLKRRWIDVGGSLCGEVRIIQEDVPLRSPREAVGKLAPLRSSSGSQGNRWCSEEGNNSNGISNGSFESKLSLTERYSLGQFRDVPRAFWPGWVYRMYDSYELARKVTDRWKQVVKAPSLDNLVMQPDLLSFHVASKIPISESTRQQLLLIDGTSYRLRREIELLESFDKLRCKFCQTLVAKRRDLLVMSSDGPLGAYANPHGFVHEVVTVTRTNGIAVIGPPVNEFSWFPGYAWSGAECIRCGAQIGWYFSARNRRLKPQGFWGIRSSQLSDDAH